MRLWKYEYDTRFFQACGCVRYCYMNALKTQNGTRSLNDSGMERTLACDGNYMSRMLQSSIETSPGLDSTPHETPFYYGHLPPISTNNLYKFDEPDTRDTAGEARTSSYVSDVLLWTPSLMDLASVGRPARTYIQQLCEDTGCNPRRPAGERWDDREK